MTDPAAHIGPDAPLDAAAKLCARQGRMLELMGEAGLELLYDLREQVRVPIEDRPDPVAVATAYEKLTRAMRLSFAMEQRLLEHPPVAPTAPAPARAFTPKPRTRADGRRDVLMNVVPEMIEAHAEREPLFDRAEAYRESERLIDRELGDEDLLARPILEIIALACKDLGVEPDWDLWKPEDWTDPEWGLTPAELSSAAHPNGPEAKRPDAWPPPGAVMPLPLDDPAPERGRVMSDGSRSAPYAIANDLAIAAKNAVAQAEAGPVPKEREDGVTDADDIDERPPKNLN